MVLHNITVYYSSVELDQHFDGSSVTAMSVCSTEEKLTFRSLSWISSTNTWDTPLIPLSSFLSRVPEINNVSFYRGRVVKIMEKVQEQIKAKLKKVSYIELSIDAWAASVGWMLLLLHLSFFPLCVTGPWLHPLTFLCFKQLKNLGISSLNNLAHFKSLLLTSTESC